MSCGIKVRSWKPEVEIAQYNEHYFQISASQLPTMKTAS